MFLTWKWQETDLWKGIQRKVYWQPSQWGEVSLIFLFLYKGCFHTATRPWSSRSSRYPVTIFRHWMPVLSFRLLKYPYFRYKIVLKKVWRECIYSGRSRIRGREGCLGNSSKAFWEQSASDFCLTHQPVFYLRESGGFQTYRNLVVGHGCFQI